MSTFQKAVKQQLKARIAIDGPTGGGKTYSALVFATALTEKTGGRIAVIDTENDRARAYADEFEFDHVSLRAPYSPQRYVDLINAAITEGYEVVVIDSLSHAWASEGGVLDIKDRATERSKSKNSFDAWRHATPEHEKLVNALVQSPIHVIGTMRSKMAYILEEDGNGKQKPRKVGMQPVQREGLEYEFDLVFDVDLDHVLVATKSRCKDLADAIIRNPNHDPTETFAAGRHFRDWLNSGEEPKRLMWLDDLCDTFGEGETMDAINTFRIQAGKQPLVSPLQVADVPEDRVALLRSYLEDQTKGSAQGEATPEADSSAEDGTPAPTSSDSPSKPGAATDGAHPEPAPSVTKGGDAADTTSDAGPADPSLRNGQSDDPQAALDRAKKKRDAKKRTGNSAQGALEEGASHRARSDGPSSQNQEDEVAHA